jgi:AcrR family transcriptional regulator
MTDLPPTSARERILDTSRELFARSGYHGSSIRDIAGALGVSVSSVYNHFRSKDAILLELLRRPLVESKQLLEATIETSTGDPPLERLTSALRGHYGYLIARKLDAELLTSEYLRLDDDTRKEIVDLRNSYEKIVRGLILGCLPESAHKTSLPLITVETNIVLGLASNSHRWFRPTGPMSPEQLVEFYVNFAIGGVRSTLGIEA